MKSFYQKMTELNLADKKIWTISTQNKEPINPKPALENHFNPQTFHEWFKLCNDPDSQLVSLTQLYKEPNIPTGLFALHVNVDEQKIMVVDVEHDFDKSIIPYLKKLPVIYGEYSKHYGAHYIVPISDEILQNPKYINLFLKSQFKIGTEDVKHSGVEIFLHNHYLTFTGNQLNIKNAAKNTNKDLKDFLDFLLQNSNTTNIKTHNYIEDAKSLPTDTFTIANHFIESMGENHLKKAVAKFSDDADVSHREFQQLMALGSRLYLQKDVGFNRAPIAPNELINIKSMDDPEILACVLLYISKDFLEFREKWNKESSPGQSYIQYICNTVITYLEKNDKNDNSE